MVVHFLVHFGLAFLLFHVVNWIGRHSYDRGYKSLKLVPQVDEAPAFNATIRIATPWVFLILAAATLYALGWDRYVEGFYLVAVYYVLFRWGYNVSWGRALLINWKQDFIYAALIVGGAWLLYDHVIRHRTSVLPDPGTVANELWIIVAIFLFHVANNVRLGPEGSEARKRRYISSRARTLRKRYETELAPVLGNEKLSAVALAIMIYEDFNRPALARVLEYALFPFGRVRTLGIMQVTTDRWISNRESVEKGVAKIVSAWERAQQESSDHYNEEHRLLRVIAKDYNPDDDYISEVGKVAQMVEEELFPETSHRLRKDRPFRVGYDTIP